MTVTPFSGPIASLPTGAIIAWHREISDIPVGWVVCDGNNGTPNLRERFPRGIPDSTTDPGGTGGQNSYTLSISQMPSHNHSAGSTSTDGRHRHRAGRRNSVGSGSIAADDKDEDYESRPNGTHSHSGHSNSEGGGSAVDNQPAYEETIYIKRIE